MRKTKTLSWLMAVVFILTTVVGVVPFQAAAAGLTDISGHWAKSQIENLNAKGVIAGFPDSTFKPDNTVTRAEFITMTNRAFSFNGTAQINYTDVKTNDWFAPEIAKAKAAGYIAGYSDGSMKPTNEISRQEVAYIVAKVLKLDTTVGAESLAKFSDAASIPDWSRSAIAAMVKAGYLNGYPDGSFKALNPTTRAMAAVILSQACGLPPVQQVFDKAGTYGPSTGTQTIDGNVTISAAGVILQNTTIKGDLLIAQSVGEGDVSFINVKVNGTTTIKGGGAHSVTLNNSNLGTVIVNKTGGNVRILATGSTTVVQVVMASGAILEESNLTSTGFTGVTVSATGAVTLKGNFGNVTIEGTNANVSVTGGTVASLTVANTATSATLNVASGAAVTTLTTNAITNITGTGSITNANYNVNGVTTTIKPTNEITAPGVTAPTITRPPSSGPGPSPTTPATVAVTGVTLDKTSLVLNPGQKVSLTATVTPANATDKSLLWSSNHPGAADVDENGVVTAVAKGQATLTVKTADGNFTAVCLVDVEVPVTGLSLNRLNLNMTFPGQTATLIPTITPVDAETNVIWQSLDTSVATVTDGVVTPKSLGTTSIVARTTEGNYSASCTVTIGEASVPVTGVSLNYTNVTLKIANTLSLIPFIAPANATNTKVSWESDDQNVATVDTNGRVTAKGNGTATITVTTDDNPQTAKCTVTVETPVADNGVSLSTDTINGFVGDADVSLTAAVLPASASNKTLVWTSSNTNAATFTETESGKGVIHFVGKGSANITATTVDGGWAASCTVNVGVRATAISLNPATATLKAGGYTFNPAVILTPAIATSSIKWQSSDINVASVNENTGVITTLAAGTTTITATPQDAVSGTSPAICAVDVFNVTRNDLIKNDQMVPGKTAVSVKFNLSGPAISTNAMVVSLNDGTVLQFGSSASGVYTYTGITNTAIADVDYAEVTIRGTVSFQLNFGS